jgi:hypothetical protein
MKASHATDNVFTSVQSRNVLGRNFVRIHRHSWVRHIHRMEDCRLHKQRLDYHPKGRRQPGRPQKRLLDDSNAENESRHPGLNSWWNMMMFYAASFALFTLSYVPWSPWLHYLPLLLLLNNGSSCGIHEDKGLLGYSAVWSRLTFQKCLFRPSGNLAWNSDVIKRYFLFSTPAPRKSRGILLRFVLGREQVEITARVVESWMRLSRLASVPTAHGGDVDSGLLGCDAVDQTASQRKGNNEWDSASTKDTFTSIY